MKFAGLALLAGCASAPADEPGPVEVVDVVSVPSLEPAHAAVARFVPSLAGDPRFAGLVAIALDEAHRTNLILRAQRTRKEAAALRSTLAKAGQPDVFLGIPYVESRLHAEATSPACAGGHWQFLPEVAIEYGLRVSGCTITGVETPWSPGDLLGTKESRPYLGAGGCQITTCAVDDRRDLARSTAAALHYLDDAARWPELQGPYVVPLQIMSFNGGVGTVQHWLRDVEPGDTFGELTECSQGRCDHLPRETALYLPRVVAAAAIVACNSSSAASIDLADFARSDLCGAFYTAGLGQEPASAQDVLVARAGKGLSVGLESLELQGYPLLEDRASIEQELALALAGVPGVTVVQGVPGEDAEALRESGADVVISGSIGRRNGRPWIRLNAGDRAMFAMIDPATFDRAHALDFAADLLVGPVREHADKALVDLLSARGGELVSCLPGAERGDRATISLVVDAKGHGAVLAGPDGPTVDCLAARIDAMTLPTELAGAAATIDVGLEAPSLADGDAQ